MAACDSESEIFRAKVAELEAALTEKKITSAAALVKACAAEAEAAVGSATATATAAASAAPALSRIASDGITQT